jgi:hypothetical protein
MPAHADDQAVRASRFAPLPRSAAAAIALAVTPAFADAQSLSLSGLTGPPVVVTADAIRAMPHRTVSAAMHGLSGTYSGVPLALLLARVAAPQGETLRGGAMTDVVVVKACDGYRVVLSLPEADSAFRDQAVILADSVNGHPLDAHEGPFRLVVEGDKRAARSARCVTAIAVKTIPQEAPTSGR